MSAFNRFSTITLMLIALVFAAGCATKSLPIEGYTPTVDISDLVRDDSEAPTIVYRRSGAPDLGDFDRFIIDPVQLYYDDPDMAELSPEQIAKLRQHFLDAMTRELTDAGYTVGTKSEAGKLRISFALSGLKAPSAGPNVTAVVIPIAARVGEVTVEAVFRDALTNQVHAVAVTRALGSRWLNPSPWSTWADVQKFCDGWAKGFRESVDAAHGR